MNTLAQIQQAVKAPKGQFNKFGNYKYRSCEDIVEAVKLVINPLGFYLTITDEIILIGTRYYVQATAKVSNGTETFSATAFAREDESIKGMAVSQITGSASSYARKYALNGLFAIDDTKDADATNDHSKDNGQAKDVPDEGEKKLLRNLIFETDLTREEREAANSAIDACSDYTTYAKIQHRLEDRKLPYDLIQNPSTSDAKAHVRKIAKQPA